MSALDKRIRTIYFALQSKVSGQVSFHDWHDDPMATRLQDALANISTIQSQLNRVESYQRFRSFAVAISAVFVLLAALVQVTFIPVPVEHPIAYLAIWLTVAISSLVVVGIEMSVRTIRVAEDKARRSQLIRVHQALMAGFLPSLIAGAVQTIFLFRVPELFWALPGIWAVTYSLGLFCCRRQLPAYAVVVAGYFLLGGCVCLLVNFGLSHWQMAILFGGGQSLLSLILFWDVQDE